ncbi:MAG TPA: branched-chain amino acid ABC transporter permease [Streptosporangiaceae bacterium]|nr:branched-chain amino acid ABC transporter permease [Streptosporangiaceae bacterium]
MTGSTGGAAVAGRAAPAAGIVALLAAAAAFPLVFTNATVTNFGVVTLIFVAVASAWNLFSGYSGYLSLGHAVFFGTGAYVTGVAARDWQLAGNGVFGLLPLAAAAAAVLAVPLGLVGLRVRRHTFVVITIAYFFIAQLAASNLAVTGGSSGLLAPVPGYAAATFNNPFYYVALVLAAGTVALSWAVRRSALGLQLRAIRDDEDRAAGLGVRVTAVKLTAFTVSALITGAAGGLWFYFLGQAYPQFAFDPLFDLAVVLMAFFGGLGTVAGPVLGALVLEPAQLYLTLQFTNGYLSEILLGLLLLVVLRFLPRGVLPAGAELLTRARARPRRAAAARPRAPAGGAPADRAPASGGGP